jgi:hypothetical protein
MRRMCFGIRGFGGWRGLEVEIRELKVKSRYKLFKRDPTWNYPFH